MYCDGEWYDCQQYDENGHASPEFSVGTLEFDNYFEEEACEGVWITHPTDWFYDGYYEPAEDWNGNPHFVNENGGHLYWLDYDGYGYWQLDYNDQDGTQDLYDGGFMYCEGEWYDCPDNYDEWGYAEYEFNIGTV